MYKRIALDIDNTITKIELTLKELADYYGKPVPTVDMIMDYNLSSVYGISEEESMSFWQAKEGFIAENSEVDVERMRRMLELFTDDKTEVYIITARSPIHYDTTFKWLNDKGIHFNKLIMTNGDSKVKVMKDNDIELMVDDKTSLFHEVNTAAIETKMVCIDYPYNKGVPCHMRLSRSGMVLESVL